MDLDGEHGSGAYGDAKGAAPDKPDSPSLAHRDDLLGLLAYLGGHFKTSSSQDEHALDVLHQQLTRALGHDDITAIRSHYLSIDGSDLFFSDAVAPLQRARLAHLADRIAQSGEREPELRVFVRNVPVRSTQIPGSVPGWAAGASVAQTLGPFTGVDGRRYWFDFFRVTRLVALYVQGNSEPVILFNTTLLKRLHGAALPLVTDAQTTYLLSPDSVWINAHLLAPNAPPGLFAGLKIRNGTLTLSAAPQLIGGKLTLGTTTRASMTLDLDPTAPLETDESSPYGVDARHSTLRLPSRFAFHFTGNVGDVDEIGEEINRRAYGQTASFRWRPGHSREYEPVLNRLLIPLECSERRLEINECKSPLGTFAGGADIERSAWALPVALLDVARPSPAAGIGGLATRCGRGLTAQWQGLQGGGVELTKPWLICDPGRLGVSELQASNAFCTQEYRLWTDDVNPHGATVKLNFAAPSPFVYNSFANGNEAYLASADANSLLDRPVTVTASPLNIRSKNSAVIVAASKVSRLLYLYDDNILFDSLDPAKLLATPTPSMAVALRNALFKVTPVNGCLLFGSLAEDMRKVERGIVFLTMGVYAYVPTLPDPYAADLGVLRAQFERISRMSSFSNSAQAVWLWLVAQTSWQPMTQDRDKVEMSFHFAPLQSQFAIPKPAPPTDTDPVQTSVAPFATATFAKRMPNYEEQWNERFASIRGDDFALLDVSSNANQMGVSFAFGGKQVSLVRTHQAAAADANGTAAIFPIQLRGLDVVARAHDVRAFLSPAISWEPVFNLTKPAPSKQDPPQPINYYPDDGGPTKIFNNSQRLVSLAPIPVCDMLVDSFANEKDSNTAAYFTLPFGLRAFALLSRHDAAQKKKPSITYNRPVFDDLEGGLQFRLTAGSGRHPLEDNMFRGYALQTANILDFQGKFTGTTTLGQDVTSVFNNEFLALAPGVPLRRIDLSGYGASTLDEWHNRDAQFASTSQTRFDIVTGRTAYEVIQVKTIMYPFAIHMVLTITLFRVGSGYVYRVASMDPVSDGKFDFSFKYAPDKTHLGVSAKAFPYSVHPGTVKGLFNVQNIRSAAADVQPYTSTMDPSGFYVVDPAIDRAVKSTGAESTVAVDLQPVYFDADVELENVTRGCLNGRVPAKKILGFVQIAPRGIPLTPAAFHALLLRQLGAIGGPLGCTMDIGKSGQNLRVNFIDVNASVDSDGVSPIFVAAARGHVVLPKEGSWSLVSHSRGTGNVTPLPENTSVPLIRVGKLNENLVAPDGALLRLANPADLLRAPTNETTNFGFLQSTNTQKVLFLTPAFAKQATDTVPGKLLSKTPPLFVDAYRLVGSKAIFPNIGNAETGFGSAIALAQNFTQNALQDGGKKVLELMHISSSDGVARLKEEGYRLANAVKKFDLPGGPWHLIDESYLKIYVEYKTTTTNGDQKATQNRAGRLDYDVDSFSSNVADRWKSRLNNMAMVVDLGPFPRLLTIKGNFDSRKGSEASYVGDPADPVNFPAPQLELSEALQKAKDILQVLAALQGGDYADAFKRGLRIAMSNGADSWEYKFEAAQEIPLIKFPPGFLANDPNAPLKLEASMKFGVYFNAALRTAALSDPKKLLPSAGAFLEFHGRMSVMCVSLSIATVYAVGECTLRITGDTRDGPMVDMKFAFGAQVVVGLPVVGNVSVLYALGVQIHTDANTLAVSAFLMYQGHAELIAGLISITITIEAKGTVKRIADQTLCAAQVTFAIDISVFLVIDIDFSKSWEEERQIA
jgi:hypothetical protein